MYPAVDPLLDNSRRSSTTSSDSDSHKRYSITSSPNPLDRALPMHTKPTNRMSHPNLTHLYPGPPSRTGSPALPPTSASTPRSQSRPVPSPPRSPASPASAIRSPAPRMSLDAGPRPLPADAVARERSYSPMAASFARLSRKDDQGNLGGASGARGRSGLPKSRTEAARMFDGPA